MWRDVPAALEYTENPTLCITVLNTIPGRGFTAAPGCMAGVGIITMAMSIITMSTHLRAAAMGRTSRTRHGRPRLRARRIRPTRRLLRIHPHQAIRSITRGTQFAQVLMNGTLKRTALKRLEG